MKCNFLVLIGVVVVNLSINGQGVQFEEKLTWPEILLKAQSANKYIFVDCWTTWCIPCREMSTEVFSDTQIANFIDSNFIAVKVQMDTGKNDSDCTKLWYENAKELKRRFNIKSYPTFCFLSPAGELVHRVIGFRDKDEFLKAAKSAIIKENQFVINLAEFYNGKQDLSFVKRLSEIGISSGEREEVERMVATYIDDLSFNQMLTTENLRFMNMYIAKSGDKAFQFFLKNRRAINKRTEPHFAERRIGWIIHLEEIRPFLNTDSIPDWNNIWSNIYMKYGQLGEEEFLRSKTFYYLKSGKDKLDSSAFHLVMQYMKKYHQFENDPMLLNNMAWLFFLRRNNRKELKEALKWSKRAVLLNPTSGNWMDTYANLLYKLGRKGDALRVQQQALVLEPNNQSIKLNLDKMSKTEKTW